MSGGITSGNFTVSLVLALFTAVCWGSWSNFFKTASVLKVPFPIFYLDFSLSIAVVAGVAFVTLFSFCKNDKTSMERVLYAVLSGLVFNGGNVLLIYGIETVGLAVAFPIGVGLGLVGGTILTYLVDPHGVDEYLLFSGVGLAFIAVLFNAYASGRLENQRKRKQTEKEYDFMSDDPINSEPKEYDAGASLFACVCAGAFITAFPTFSTFAAKSNEALGPYGIPLVSNGAVFVSSLIATIFASFWYPKAGLKAYFSAGFKMHIWGFLGGFVWAIGSLCFVLAGESLSFAISYSIGQAAPLIATMWGVFYYHEFKGADCVAKLCIFIMVILYVTAILLIAKSS